MARPRSAQAHRKVLEAAVELFAGRGIDATSMDAIAEASGVSKATIYKHWLDKDALCLEVLGHIHGLDEEVPIFDSGDFRTDLIAQLQHEPAADRKALKDRIWPHLIAYSARNPEFGRAWRAKVLEPARVAFVDLMKRGEKLGVLQPGVDPEAGIAILLGPMIYQHVFVRRLGKKVPKNLEVYVADAFLGAFGRTGRPGVRAPRSAGSSSVRG
jgi:AcrR family transcriptional regulator